MTTVGGNGGLVRVWTSVSIVPILSMRIVPKVPFLEVILFTIHELGLNPMRHVLMTTLIGITTKMECVLFKISESKFNAFEKTMDRDFYCYFFSIYKCFYGKSILPLDQHAQCKEAQNVEKCIKELHPNCMGFFLRQLPLFNQLMFVQRDPSESIPECMKAFPSRANEYPILKKLVEELQQLLN